MGRGLHTVLLCALLRHASVGSREQVQPPLPPPRRRPIWGGGGVPSAPGGRRAAPVAPQLGGVRGGGGAPPPPALGPEWEGGGWSGGGPLVPWRRLLTAGGGAWQSRPRGPAIGLGVAPFPRPPLPRAGPSCRPSLGPLIPPTVVARRWPPGGGGVWVSGKRLAGCGAAGSPPRSLSPPSLPREVARSHASCRTVGGAWVGGPSSHPPTWDTWTGWPRQCLPKHMRERLKRHLT